MKKLIAMMMALSIIVGLSVNAEAHGEVQQLNAVGAEALRFCESTNNYSSVHLDRYQVNGKWYEQWVYGAYQFTQPTWDWVMREIGFTDAIGVPPSEVDMWTQDYAAVWLWNHDPEGKHHKHWATKCWQAAINAMVETPHKRVSSVTLIPSWGPATEAPIPVFTGLIAA